MVLYHKLRSDDWRASIQAFVAKNIYLMIALAVCTPLYFVNVFKYTVPMGYAGLFTQMAKQIADANFQLPMVSPFYGPGGIPFAYPPFGMYLLAVIIKLTGKYFIFLRFIPPFLGIVSFIPLYYLTLGLSKSRIAAVTTVIIAAGSPDLYIAHAWAAGIVRAPAFIFALTSIFFFLRQEKTRSRVNLVWAGVFFGLTCMSHLMYTLFAFLWIWWWSIFNRNFFSRIRDALAVSGIGLLVASIWLVPVLLRYGIEVFLSAFGSHGGDGVFSFWLDPRALFHLFQENIHPVTTNRILSALILTGVLFLMTRKKITFISYYLLVVLAFPESARFVFLMGSISAGIGLSAVVSIFSGISTERLRPVIVAGLLVPILGFLWWKGYSTLNVRSPRFDNAMLDLADYIQNTTSPDQKYLALVKQDEAEWLPFLFEREPVIGHWGSEWLGKFTEQTYFMALFGHCVNNQDWMCVKETFATVKVKPDYLVSYAKNKRLNGNINLDSMWTKIYENDRYVIWKIAH